MRLTASVLFPPSLLLKGDEMKYNKYKCDVCDYIYDPRNGDPENGFKAGINFEDLPLNWVCPVCGIEKDYFCSLEKEKSNYREKSRIASIVSSIFPQELKKQWHNIHG